MERISRANQPMRLEGSRNTRDLGGYPTSGGVNTVNGAFLRSDKTSGWTERDKEILYDYGLRFILDLRSEDETEREPCALKGYRDVEYENIQFFDNIYSKAANVDLSSSLGETYFGLLENSKVSFLNAFRAMLRHQEACILYNCTGGKDRTGLITMLLLSVAGVPDEVILADYAATYFNIKEDIERFKAASPIPIPDFLFESDPENMRLAMGLIKRRYGEIDNYLLNIGLREDEIGILQNKLLGRPCDAVKMRNCPA